MSGGSNTEQVYGTVFACIAERVRYIHFIYMSNEPMT